MKYLKKFNEEASKRFTLDSDSESKVKNMIDDLFRFCQKNKNSKKFKLYKSIDLKTIDGQEFNLPIYVDKDFEGGQAGIGFKDTDLQPRYVINNLLLIINPKYVFSKKSLYVTLYHEILHAVDPTITSKYSKKYLDKYGDAEGEPEKYFSHGIELRGITGEFLEALVQEYTERIELCESSEELQELEDSLNSIVGFFNELQLFNPLAHDILHNMDGIIGIEKTEDDEPNCLVNIDLIRTHSPKGWKMFLTMLYTTSEEIKEIINQKLENLEIVEESVSSLSTTKPLSDEEFLEIFNKNCKNFSFSNDQLFRACNSKYPLSIFVESQRMIGGGDVWYGQYPGYSDFFKKISKDRERFPVLRTHSLIGSMHGLDFAKDIMSFGANGYLVIPFDDTKIVLTPYPDLGMATKMSMATKFIKKTDPYKKRGKINFGYVDEDDFIMVKYTKDFKFPENELDKINPKVRKHDGMKKMGIEKQGEFFTNGPCLLVSEDKIDWLKSNMKTLEGLGSFISGIKDKFKKNQEEQIRKKKEKEEKVISLKNNITEIEKNIKTNVPDILQILADEGLENHWSYSADGILFIKVDGIFNKKIGSGDSKEYRSEILKKKADIGEAMHEVIDRIEDIGLELCEPHGNYVYYGSTYIGRSTYTDRYGLKPTTKLKIEYIRHAGGNGRDSLLGDIIDGDFYKNREAVYLFFSLPDDLKKLKNTNDRKVMFGNYLLN